MGKSDYLTGPALALRAIFHWVRCLGSLQANDVEGAWLFEMIKLLQKVEKGEVN
jgi:hypothetical protein